MTYSRSTINQPLIILPALYVVAVPSLDWLQVLCIIFIICNVYITYTIRIDTDVLHYTFQLFGKTLYSKQLQPAQITGMTFKRIGWAAKRAIVHTDSGLPIRLGHFKGHELYDHLLAFCEQHSLSVHKTKDFTILEKMNRSTSNEKAKTHV